MASGTAIWLPDIKIIGIKEDAADTDEKSARAGISEVNNPSLSSTSRRKADARLAEDKFGEEMAPDATIWELYEEEANDFDDELIDGRSNNLDMMLLFVSTLVIAGYIFADIMVLHIVVCPQAGLFSAVVTSFVIESKNMLQQDSGDASLALLLSIARSQQRLAEGNTQPVSPIVEIPPFEVTQSARWINGLWFASLALSLGAALIAMLAKEWLVAYASSRPRSPYDHVVAHQRRLQGLGRWYALHIIDFLPTILHFALLLFSLGLVVYLWLLDYAIAASVVVIVGLSALFYTATAILAAIYPFCPFVTQISKYIRRTLISSQMVTPPTDTSPQARSSIPTSLEALQALKWLAENAQDQVAADCSYQALSGIKLSNNKLENPSDNAQEERPAQSIKPTAKVVEIEYTLLAEMFQTICNRIPLALVSGSGQLSASQGISVSRYASALPHLVWYLETTLVEPSWRKTKEFQDRTQSLADKSPTQCALEALDFAWANDRPHYTADTYALLTAAELHLTAIAASQHGPEQPGPAPAPASPLPLEHANDSKVDVSAQSWLILDVKDAPVVPAKRIPLFDLRARFSRALFRATVELKYHADEGINIREDALVYLLKSIRLGFYCPALNPDTPLSTHHRQNNSHEGPPVLHSMMVGTGVFRYLEPTEIDDEDGLIVSLMRTVGNQATSESHELVQAAMHTLCAVSPTLLRQWLNMNLNSSSSPDEQTRITATLSHFQTLQPMTPEWDIDMDVAYVLRTWSMKQLLFTVLISGAFLDSDLLGIQQLSGPALQTLRKLTKGSIGQTCAVDTASESFPLVLKLIQRARLGQHPLPELKNLVQWLLVTSEIDNDIVIQNARRNNPMPGTDVYLELLEIWVQVPGLDPELERLVHKIVEGPMDDILVPLWTTSGLLKLASIGDHPNYAPILSELVVFMIESSLGDDHGQSHWKDPSHKAALPHFIQVVGRVLSVTSPSSENATLSQAYIRAISSLKLHLQANLVEEGLGPYEKALKMIRQVPLSTLSTWDPSDQFKTDYEALLNLADDSDAWMYGILPSMLRTIPAPEDEASNYHCLVSKSSV